MSYRKYKRRMAKRKFQYLTTIVTISKDKDELILQKIYGAEAVAEEKKNSIKLRNGKTAIIALIAVAMLVCGVCAIMFEPSFGADVFLSVFSGLLTGLILLIYSGYNTRLRESYSLKVTHLENISREISDVLKWQIFDKVQTISEGNLAEEDTTIVSQTNDICRLVIKLNGIEDINWMNKKNKYAHETYYDMLYYACIMQNRMGTAMAQPSTQSKIEKNIDDQDLYDYIIKMASDLPQYKRILDRIILQIKQQIRSFDKSIL